MRYYIISGVPIFLRNPVMPTTVNYDALNAIIFYVISEWIMIVLPMSIPVRNVIIISCIHE